MPHRYPSAARLTARALTTGRSLLAAGEQMARAAIHFTLVRLLGV